ncbi:MAG: hypothetical protein AB7F86_05280 [Bdellovibrionales bacterium]
MSSLRSGFLVALSMIGVVSFQNCSPGMKASDSSSQGQSVSPMQEILDLSKLTPGDIAGLTDDEIIEKIIESLEITIQFLQSAPVATNPNLIKRLENYILRLKTDAQFRREVLAALKTAPPPKSPPWTTTPPPAPAPSPAPPPPPPPPNPDPADIKCFEFNEVIGDFLMDRGTCLTNGKVEILQIEKAAADVLGTTYDRVICHLDIGNLSRPHQILGYPLIWECNGIQPRVQWTQATGFRSRHLNSPFRCTAEKDPPIGGNPGDEGYVPIVTKSDRFCYFNKEEFPASALQDAIDEAFENRTRYPDQFTYGRFEFQNVECNLVDLPNTSIKGLRCTYSNPVSL